MKSTAQLVEGPYPAEHRAHSLSRSQLSTLLGRLGTGGLAGGPGSLPGAGLRGPRLNTLEAKFSNFCRADISRSRFETGLVMRPSHSAWRGAETKRATSTTGAARRGKQIARRAYKGECGGQT